MDFINIFYIVIKIRENSSTGIRVDKFVRTGMTKVTGVLSQLR